MTISSKRTLPAITIAAALLAAVAAAAGLFWPNPVASLVEFQSVHGETVELFGRGIYRLDSRMLGAGFVGQDFVTLLIAVPALLLAQWRAWLRANPGWSAVRLALLAYVLYAYATMALGAFYNEMFLVYVAAFSASLFAVGLSLKDLSARLQEIWSHTAPRLPRTMPAVLLVVCGVFTGVIWAQPLVAALLIGSPPPLLGHATTKVTEALDLAIIVPATLVAAALIWQRRIAGYLGAIPLLGLLVMLVPTIAASTVSQLIAGVTFTTAEIVGPITGFLVLGAAGAVALWQIIRAVSASTEDDVSRSSECS